MACQGFLVRGACIYVLVGGTGSLPLKCNELSSSEFWSVYVFGMSFDSLYCNAQGCVPVLLENYHSMSCCGICWLLGGAWFQFRYGSFWMNCYQLMFPGVRGFLVFLTFGFKPPASGFQSFS